MNYDFWLRIFPSFKRVVSCNSERIYPSNYLLPFATQMKETSSLHFPFLLFSLSSKQAIRVVYKIAPTWPTDCALTSRYPTNTNNKQPKRKRPDVIIITMSCLPLHINILQITLSLERALGWKGKREGKGREKKGWEGKWKEIISLFF